VREAHLDHGEILVTYSEQPVRRQIVWLPDTIPISDITLTTRYRGAGLHGHAVLWAARLNLDRGALVVVSRGGWTTVPPHLAGGVDQAIHALQAIGRSPNNRFDWNA
jgi:hypothetical protein